MKEIEIKAHADMSLKSELDVLAGKEGVPVEKDDLYFRWPGERIQALRIRLNNGRLELTAKNQGHNEGAEDNLEYEISLDADQRDNAIAFFKCLGYIEYFRKYKRGFSWVYEGIHIELLSVNDLGVFFEAEALLPFDSSREDEEKARKKLFALIDRFGLRDSIEMTSYREMILNGIQGKSYSGK